MDHDTRAYWMALGIVAVTASVPPLSAAGIYAMMSFTWRVGGSPEGNVTCDVVDR